MSLESFEHKFAEKGLSFTSQRRAIAMVVMNADDHPDIDEIFFRVKQIDKTASIATVYRTVNLFTELGLISKREFKNKKSRYEFKSDGDHNHIILDGGEIIEFKNHELDEIIQKIAKTYNLTLKDYILEVYCSKN